MVGMTESELLHVLTKHPDTRHCFKGVFTKEDLVLQAPVLDENSFLVYNTASRREGGLHWVTLYRPHHSSVMLYADSLAMSPDATISDYFQRHDLQALQFNTRPIQSPLSERCGEFAAVFAHDLCKLREFPEMRKDYDQNHLLINDILVVCKFRKAFGYERFSPGQQDFICPELSCHAQACTE
jgi:hypothetical protein